MTTTTKTRKTTKTSTGPKVDAYKVITDKIVEALEEGVVPWKQPWNARLTGPRSLSTGKAYQGVNVFMLLFTSMSRGYGSQWWGTYKQISERGGQVRKGEKGTPVVFWRILEVKDDKAPDGKKKIPMLRYFTVFNADQCDDVKVPTAETFVDVVDPIEEADRIVQAYLTADGPTLNHGGNSAAYSPVFDTVVMPETNQFLSTDGYYSTLFHELGHSTGHKDRLNRDGITDPIKFGSEKYGKEELVAEMSAAFLCAEAGVEVDQSHHVGYIGSWLETIKGDPKLVVQAAGAAQKATNMILCRDKTTEGEEN